MHAECASAGYICRTTRSVGVLRGNYNKSCWPDNTSSRRSASPRREDGRVVQGLLALNELRLASHSLRSRSKGPPWKRDEKAKK